MQKLPNTPKEVRSIMLPFIEYRIPPSEDLPKIPQSPYQIEMIG